MYLNTYADELGFCNFPTLYIHQCDSTKLRSSYVNLLQKLYKTTTLYQRKGYVKLFVRLFIQLMHCLHSTLWTCCLCLFTPTCAPLTTHCSLIQMLENFIINWVILMSLSINMWWKVNNAINMSMIFCTIHDFFILFLSVPWAWFFYAIHDFFYTILLCSHL